MKIRLTPKIASIIEAVALVAAILVIPSIIIEQSNPNSAWSSFTGVLNWVIWSIFLTEAVILLVLTSERKKWLQSHPLEIIVILVSSPIMPVGLQSARVFRLVRLARLARLGRVASFARKTFSLTGLYWATFLSFLIVIGGGAAFTTVEKGQNLSSWDGIYWAISTVTTMGSDVAPATAAGRIISIGVLIVGTGFIAILTAAIAERFMRYAKTNPNIETADAEVLARLDKISARLSEIEKKLPK